jgi:hypothetical protein
LREVLSGWVGEVGSRVGERCQFYQKFKNTRDHSDENHRSKYVHR